jgi:hypothetical protein
MKYEMRYISPASLIFSVVPVVLVMMGFLGALLSFVFFPDPSVANIPILSRLVAVVSFTLVYALALEVVVLICAFTYNLFCSMGLKGISLEFYSVESRKDQ